MQSPSPVQRSELSVPDERAPGSCRLSRHSPELCATTDAETYSGRLCSEGSVLVFLKTKWLAALVLITGAVAGARAQDQQTYGPPEPRTPVNLRPYSQRSFRGYYVRRAVEHF